MPESRLPRVRRPRKPKLGQHFLVDDSAAAAHRRSPGRYFAAHRARNRARPRRADFPAGPAGPPSDRHRTRPRAGGTVAHELCARPTMWRLSKATSWPSISRPCLDPSRAAPARASSTNRNPCAWSAIFLISSLPTFCCGCLPSGNISRPSCSWCSARSRTGWPRPGKQRYGLLSATAQLYGRVEKLFTLPPGLFSAAESAFHCGPAYPGFAPGKLACAGGGLYRLPEARLGRNGKRSGII